MARRASGALHVMASRALDFHVPGNVREPLTDGCRAAGLKGSAHPRGFRVEDASRLQRTLCDQVTKLRMTPLAGKASLVLFVREAYRGPLRSGIRVTVPTAGVWNLCGNRAREPIVPREVGVDLLERLGLVSQPRKKAPVDMAVDAPKFAVHTSGPSAMVGPHLVTRGAELGPVRSECCRHGNAEQQQYCGYGKKPSRSWSQPIWRLDAHGTPR